MTRFSRHFTARAWPRLMKRFWVREQLHAANEAHVSRPTVRSWIRRDFRIAFAAVYAAFKARRGAV